jgi:hypothetical protein
MMLINSCDATGVHKEYSKLRYEAISVEKIIYYYLHLKPVRSRMKKLDSFIQLQVLIVHLIQTHLAVSGSTLSQDDLQNLNTHVASHCTRVKDELSAEDTSHPLSSKLLIMLEFLSNRYHCILLLIHSQS